MTVTPHTQAERERENIIERERDGEELWLRNLEERETEMEKRSSGMFSVITSITTFGP